MANSLPEVRQCQDPNDGLYGAVAVRTEIPGPWGVFTVRNGGHHADESEVESWSVLIPAPTTIEEEGNKNE